MAKKEYVIPLDDPKDSLVADRWYTTTGMRSWQDKADGVGEFQIITGYKTDVSHLSDEAIKLKKAELLDEVKKAKLGSIVISESNVDTGSGRKKMLHVFDPDSIDKLESLWGRKGIELDVDRLSKYGVSRPDSKKEQGLAGKIKEERFPGWKSYLAWDVIGVVGHTPDQDAVARRINFDLVPEAEQPKLLRWLNEAGIQFSERVASTSSPTVPKGARSLRVRDPESVKKLDKMFVDNPPAEQDWRNLDNWIIPMDRALGSRAFNTAGMKKRQEEQLKYMLEKWGVSYFMVDAQNINPNAKPGEEMCVTDSRSFARLKQLTRLWTKEKAPSNVVRRGSENGGM